MVINIASKDKRYEILNEILRGRGSASKIVDPLGVEKPDLLILSARRELNEGELDTIFEKLGEKTVVLSGNGRSLSARYGRKVIDYTENEEFLQKNAYLTAEACISYLHSSFESSLFGKKFFISGYGRIGKCLARILYSLGGKIFIFARREEVRRQVEKDGFTVAGLDTACECDFVLNTVPHQIFSADLISKIPKETRIVELASICGFENTERVNFALGLPGKILPKSAAKVIYEAIEPYLERGRN